MLVRNTGPLPAASTAGSGRLTLANARTPEKLCTALEGISMRCIDNCIVDARLKECSGSSEAEPAAEQTPRTQCLQLNIADCKLMVGVLRRVQNTLEADWFIYSSQ